MQSNQLIIQIPPNAEGMDPEIHWGWLGKNGRLSHGVSDLSALVEQFRDHNIIPNRLVVTVPSEEVLITQVANLPSTSARLVQRALPFAVEEQLAQDVETVHLAAQSKITNNTVSLCAVDIEKMDYWDSLIKQTQFSPDVMMPDVCGVPMDDADWTVLLDDERALIRNGELSGIAVEKQNVAALLCILAAEMPKPEPTMDGVDSEGGAGGHTLPTLLVKFVGTKESLESCRDMVAGLKASLDGKYVLDARVRVAGGFDKVLCNTLSEETPSVNLLIGDYKTEAKKQRKLSGPWQPLAWVAAIWLTLQLGVDVYKTSYYENKAVEIKQEAKTLYRNIFPQDKRVVNVVRQMRDHLSSGAGGSDLGFLSLLGKAGSELQAAGLKSQIEFQSLKFDERRGELTIDIHAKAIDQVEKYKDSLTKKGLSAELGSVTSDKGVVKGRIRIKGAAS